MPGEKTWDLNNAELGGFDTMETNPEVHDNAARRRDLATPPAHPEERCDGEHDKFVATQALLVARSLSRAGAAWTGGSSSRATHDRRGAGAPTVGRCKRAALVAKLGRAPGGEA